MPERFIVTESHDSDVSTAMAIQFALSVCKQNRCELVICLAAKGMIHNSPFRTLFTTRMTSALKQGKPVAADKVLIWLESVRTLGKIRQRSVIVAPWHEMESMKMIDKIDCNAIVYLPWTDTDRDEWQSLWNPKLIVIDSARRSDG
jgi:hypothetical protein